MQENRKIIQKIEGGNRKFSLVLATVVDVEGSAYRREGAKILIGEEGILEGVISGGCLEPDVVETAKEVMAKGKPVLKTYDMDEELVWGLGLGCPGTVTIYIEPVYHPNKINSPFAKWISAVKREGTAVLCTILNDAPTLSIKQGERVLINQTKNRGIEQLSDVRSANQEALREVADLVRKKLQERHPKSATVSLNLHDTIIDVFLDVHVPPAELLIFGAGHDAIPLGKKAVELGFKTTVVDPRPAYNKENRFPNARCLLADPAKENLNLEISPRTYIVIMNHHIERDVKALTIALKSEATYVGVLGPDSRLRRLLDKCKKEGITFTDEQLSRLYGPVGLDIGAESADEIAISIIAEVLAVKNGHSGTFLREKKLIHQPTKSV